MVSLKKDAICEKQIVKDGAEEKRRRKSRKRCAKSLIIVIE